MSRVWFATPLETVATFWRVLRRDGVTLGFVTHDRDLWFDGVRHRAAPGMIPSAIRRSAGLAPDSAEVTGVLSHDVLAAADFACGRYDGAAIRIGLVDWQSGETAVLYGGTIGHVTLAGDQVQAELVSAKATLQRDPVPRTSPTCRAQFCGPDCGLSPERFSARATVAGYEPERNAVVLVHGADPAIWGGGRIRWLDGPLAGTGAGIVATSGSALILDSPLPAAIPPGSAVRLRQGCDRTMATCATRFGNARNFRGEPDLPGNDFVARTPGSP